MKYISVQTMTDGAVGKVGAFRSKPIWGVCPIDVAHYIRATSLDACSILWNPDGTVDLRESQEVTHIRP